ncbi:MAG TPA: helix-turn-helix domain-containing protein [Rhodopila sp.]|jgi:transcriptional regulator of acetoin/glycerol metabolism|nr:helix-turn-helix domain-containing protein [Rhodopila sp.]
MPANSAHASKIHQSVQAGAAVKSDIAASRQRCLTRYNLQPDIDPRSNILTRFEIDQRLAHMAEPIRLAEAELNGFARSMSDIGGALSLTDGEGATLMSWISRTGLLASRKFQPGTVWSEATEGTNGVGTCLQKRRPVSIALDKHVFRCNSGYSCVTSPIFSPIGDIAGTLNVSFANSSVQSILSILLKGLVEACQKLEATWFGAHYADCMIVTVADAPAGGGSTPLAAVRPDLRVTGATHAVRRHHRLPRDEIALGLPVAQILPRLDMPARSLKDAEFDIVTRMVNQFGGRVDDAAAHLGLSRATMYRKLQVARMKKKASQNGD